MFVHLWPIAGWAELYIRWRLLRELSFRELWARRLSVLTAATGSVGRKQGRTAVERGTREGPSGGRWSRTCEGCSDGGQRVWPVVSGEGSLPCLSRWDSSGVQRWQTAVFLYQCICIRHRRKWWFEREGGPWEAHCRLGDRGAGEQDGIHPLSWFSLPHV